MSKADYEKLQKQIEDMELDHSLSDYHAFIYWFIETAFGYPGSRILNSICDGTHDKGIDAVIIDPIELKVVIVQSKYERAGGRVQISDNDIKLTAAIKNYFDSRSSLEAAIIRGNEVAKRLMREAFDAIRRKKHALELLFISTHRIAPHLDALIHRTLGFAEDEFRVYHYDRIMQLYYDKMRDFTPGLGVYNLPFVDSDKSIIKTSPHKSWVITISAEEICSLVNKHEDNLFRKNVRNFLGKSRTNKKILETLEIDPTNFWYYNNGITVLCDRANIVMEEGYVRLENPQIVNGCQTVKSIQQFGGELQGEVMVRIVESTDHKFINYLTLYQNSSNPVRNRDLKSNDPVQVRLKHEFSRQGYYYEIKRGEEYERMARRYPYLKSEFKGKVISNELVAKLLATVALGPSIGLSFGSDRFFGDYYDEIFPSDLSTFNCLAPFYIYEDIRDTYTGKTKKFYIFEKDWVFKNRALHYVLAFIYRSMRGHGNWERDFVTFHDRSAYDEYQRFYKKLSRNIDRYFKCVYKAWDRTQIEYYNTYLQNSRTMRRILTKCKTEISNLNDGTEKIFLDLAGQYS